MGGCPYLLRSITFRQFVAKGGTLGSWNNYNIGCSNIHRLPYSLMVSTALSVFSESVAVTLEDSGSWGQPEGMLGLRCDTALSAQTEGAWLKLSSVICPAVTQQVCFKSSRVWRSVCTGGSILTNGWGCQSSFWGQELFLYLLLVIFKPMNWSIFLQKMFMIYKWS